MYEEYNNLINSLYNEKTEGDTKSKKNKKNTKINIKSDINRYYERDDFAHLLNKKLNVFSKKKKKRKR